MENEEQYRGGFGTQSVQKMRPVTPTWIRQVTTALSRKYGVTVREGKNWAMNVEKAELHYVPSHLQAIDQDTVLGILLHEIGHLRHSDNDWVESSAFMKLDPNRMHTIVNVFEDVRVNELMSRSYGGSRELITAMDELAGSDRVREIREMSATLKSGASHRGYYPLSPEMETMLIVLNKVNGVWKDSSDSEHYNPEIIVTANAIIDRVKKLEVVEAPNTSQVSKFVEYEVLPLLDEFVARANAPKPKQKLVPQRGNGDGSDGEGMGGDMVAGDAGAGDSESDELSDNSGKNGNSKNDDEPESDEDGSSQSDDESDSDEDSEADDGTGDSDESDSEEQSSSGGSKGGNGVSTKGRSDGLSVDDWRKDIVSKIQKAMKRGRVNPDEDFRTNPFQRKDPVRHKQVIEEQYNAERISQAVRPLISRFKNKLEVIFKDNHSLRETPRQRSGRLDMRKLVRFKVNQDSRVFKKAKHIDFKSYSVAFMTDCSGSMNSERTFGAMSALVAMSETLEAIGVRYAVGFFADVFDIGKKFDEPRMNKRKLSLSGSQNGGNTNPDGLIKELLEKQLVSEPTDKKIAIILTDGEWYGGHSGMLRNFAKRNPNILVYVVGLCLGDGQVQAVQNQFGIGEIQNMRFVEARTPSEVLERYLEIAKRDIV